MSKTSVGRAPAPKKSGGKAGLFIGILMGMVLGLVVAGGVAWYLMKLPSPFTAVEQQPEAPVINKPLVKTPPRVTPVPEQPVASAPAAASAVADGKPRFDFYKVLTDKQDTSVPTPKVVDKSVDAETATQPAPDNATYYLQTGSYSSTADADNEKARLAMLGQDANISHQFVQDKGTRYFVRLGPYKGAAEMNKARATLRQNGITATPVKAQ
ncbi:MAG: SPOR domain-containing protein [Nitrosomonadales bacterium]|nr:SPOR domain-containing protein [Nitrosomonadales bacterium]